MHETVANILRVLLHLHPPMDLQQAINLVDNALAILLHALAILLHVVLFIVPYPPLQVL